jgi:uracil-DNA glycosylase
MAQIQPKLDFPDTGNVAKLPFADYAAPTKKWNQLILVGEAPGAEEARTGKPFVGRSGQLLDKILERAGIDRAETLIANVFRYQPPANKVDTFFISKRASVMQKIEIAEEFGKFGSAFCREAFAGELRHLGEMLATKKPKIVIALGRTPMWGLTGENGLLSKVGQTLPCRLAESVTVIPTYHPSFILRGNWGLQDEWLSHFTKATKYLK